PPSWSGCPPPREVAPGKNHTPEGKCTQSKLGQDGQSCYMDAFPLFWDLKARFLPVGSPYGTAGHRGESKARLPGRTRLGKGQKIIPRTPGFFSPSREITRKRAYGLSRKDAGSKIILRLRLFLDRLSLAGPTLGLPQALLVEGTAALQRVLRECPGRL